ncbi:Alpha/beta knot methyltransferase [Dichotomocladium elegans]|nr:Alpha/beta knot methyltransferase [Dichotomocladium elegans]
MTDHADQGSDSTSTTPSDTPSPEDSSSPAAKQQLIVILENASLEAAKLNPFRFDSKMQLLNCDEHQSILKRLGRDIADARPDIVHQCLLALLDSPLNKSGHLQVYIHTAKGVVIRINPECRIPRTIKRFSGLMVQLLEKGCIVSGEDSNNKLLEIIPPPVTQYIPENAMKLAMSWNAPKVRLYKYFKEIPEDKPIVVAVGAMAKGADTFADAYCDSKIGISSYALSASVACSKVCCALEDLWDIM